MANLNVQKVFKTKNMGGYPSNIQAGGDEHKRYVCCIFFKLCLENFETQ